MKNTLFPPVSPAWKQFAAAARDKKTVALTGLPDHMAAFAGAKLAEETGLRVLLLTSNDLKATHDADDGQQLLGNRAVCLPGGEIDLTRGASSHESAWRRLETLSRVMQGEVSLLCTSVDAAVQRMGSPVRFRDKTIRLQPGDEYAPQQLVRDLTAITGQKAIITMAKKSVANFKVREGMPVGAKVTLRGDKMWEFLDRLFNVALPRVRDFRGISADGFDGRGNYALGIKEQLIFPEIEYDKIDKIRGMDIIICTTAETDEEAKALLELVGAPFER